MKYLKTFEDKSDYWGDYWLLPTDERLKKSLEQINCDDNFIDNILRNIHIKILNFVFIGYSNSSKDFGWVPYDNDNVIDNNYYKDNNYKFKGLINIKKYELTAKKYNL